MKLFDWTTGILERALSLRLKRHNLIASNLANVDTPNYRAKDITFREELQRVMAAADEQGQVKPALFTVEPRVNELGPVDIDQEMTKLAENNLMYDALAQMLANKFERLKNAIVEGGR